MAELLLIARLAGRRIAFPAADVEAAIETAVLAGRVDAARSLILADQAAASGKA